MTLRHTNMKDRLLTAGEFAKLARTTKRTVLWYDAQGLLTPHKTDASGYRWYAPRQIIEFQVILLLRKQGFSLAEIDQYVRRPHSLEQLFAAKEAILSQNLHDLQRQLSETRRYSRNLLSTATLVDPIVKRVEPYVLYCIDKQGPYAKINDYHREFRTYFTKLPRRTEFATAFMERIFDPQASHFKIALLARPGVVIRPGSPVGRLEVPAYKALCYTHNGSPALLSLLSQELERYRMMHDLPVAGNPLFSDIEFYRSPGPPDLTHEDALSTELHILLDPRARLGGSLHSAAK